MPDIERALTTLNTGAYLIPEVIDAGIRDYIAKATPLLQVVTRVPWATNVYTIRKRVTVGAATWGTDGGSLPAATNSTYEKVTSSVKYLYTRGEVTGPMIAAAGSVANALQTEIQISSRVMAEQLTQDVAAGDGSSNSITGILNQIDSGAVGDEGGTIDAAGVLTLNWIDQAIDATQGECDVILTSRAVRRKIATLLQAQQQFAQSTEIGAGFRVLTYDGIPIITDLHWEANDTIVFFRRADAKLIVNQDFVYSPLAKTKDSEDYFIKGYFGFALEGRPVKLTFTTVTT